MGFTVHQFQNTRYLNLQSGHLNVVIVAVTEAQKKKRKKKTNVADFLWERHYCRSLPPFLFAVCYYPIIITYAPFVASRR